MRKLLTVALLLPIVVAHAAGVRGTVSLSKGSPAGHAVVYLEGGAHSHPLANAVVDQRDRQFLPHISVVTIGTNIHFPNHDTIFHNVFADFDAKRFDLGMYPRGASVSQRFDKCGVVSIMCSVHPDMSAYVMVVNTPFYTIADSAGRYSISNVPPGSYTLKVWHESGQIEARTIQVSAANPELNVRTHRH